MGTIECKCNKEMTNDNDMMMGDHVKSKIKESTLCNK
jgi:hypothetical protein